MLNVLLVEDNSALRVIELRYLKESLGQVTVQTAGTAADAVKIAKSIPLDIVVLDCGLPDASDTDVATLLHPHCPGASFIVTSAHPPDIERLREICPGVQILPKPFEPEDLVSLVKGTVSASHPPADSLMMGGENDYRAPHGTPQHEIMNLLAVAMANICAMEVDLLAEAENPNEIRAILAQDIPSLKQTIKITAERLKACLNSNK